VEKSRVPFGMEGLEGMVVLKKIKDKREKGKVKSIKIS